jgi:hypothetical protein
MAKMVLDTSTLETSERNFPEACKFCFEEDCPDCPFLEDRLILEADLLLQAEPTLETFFNS